jgi:hypothetical protein
MKKISGLYPENVYTYAKEGFQKETVADEGKNKYNESVTK